MPPRTAIKSQVLADFIAEWTKVQMPPTIANQEYWMMYFDGSLMKKGAGAGLVFISSLGVRIMMRTWHLRIRTMIIRCARSYICIVALVIIHLVPHVHVTI